MLASSLGAAFGVLVLVYLGVIILTVVAWVKILSKAGYSGWWVLIGIVPLVNVIMFFVFAFSEWPVLREQSSGRPDPGWPQATR